MSKTRCRTAQHVVLQLVAGAWLAASPLGCQPQEPKSPETAAASAPSAEGAPSGEGAPAEAPAGEKEEEKRAAQSSAESWLVLVDQTQYGPSWDAAAPLFQTKVTKEQWENAVKSARTPLGDLATRKFRAAEYKPSLPGAPDGEYVIVYYDTSFAHKASARESVTLARTPDGSWRVVGYFVQ